MVDAVLATPASRRGRRRNTDNCRQPPPEGQRLDRWLTVEQQIQTTRARDRGERSCAFGSRFQTADPVDSMSSAPGVGTSPGPGHVHPLLDERHVDVRGLSIRLSVEGEGPPLVLINGLAANIELWQPLRMLLPARRTIAFDAPGVGGSPRPSGLLRLADLADLVADVVSTVGEQPVDVRGYSLGGAIAQEFVRRHRRHVRRLVLAATTPGLGAFQNPLVLLRLAALATRGDTPVRRAAVVRVVGGRVSRDPAMLAWVERAHRLWPLDRPGAVAQLGAMVGWSSLGWLHTIDVPTLALGAERDPLVPAVNTRLFVSRMPACQRYIVPGAGHLFLIDQPEDAAGVIESFLSH
jgi:pimeloyl-ACP methyl ester carboxylesterase